MNDTAPLISIGDLIDKLSILIRKIYFGEDSAYTEYCAIVEGLTSLGIDGEIIASSIRLAQANIEIWNLENEMRRNPTQLADMTIETLADYGKRAIQIRDLNRKRIQAKNSINDLTSSFKEVKVNHASQ